MIVPENNGQKDLSGRLAESVGQKALVSADESVAEFRVITISEYQQLYKELSSTSQEERKSDVGEPSVIAKYECPSYPIEYRVVKKFPLLDWEMGREMAIKLTDNQLAKAKYEVKNFKKMTKVLFSLSQLGLLPESLAKIEDLFVVDSKRVIVYE